MAEWSKAVDLRPTIHSNARVRTPLRAINLWSYSVVVSTEDFDKIKAIL